MVAVDGKTKRPGGGKPSKTVPTANMVCTINQQFKDRKLKYFSS